MGQLKEQLTTNRLIDNEEGLVSETKAAKSKKVRKNEDLSLPLSQSHKHLVGLPYVSHSVLDAREADELRQNSCPPAHKV